MFDVLSVEIDWVMDYESGFYECRAKIKVRFMDRRKISYGYSRDGQINAFDNALKSAISEFFPEIKKCQTTDFKVSLIEGEKGTQGFVRVFVEVSFNGEKISTETISSDMINASIEALSSCYKTILSKFHTKEH